MHQSKIKQSNFDYRKYNAFQAIHLPERQWPNNTISQAPRWCSVDLRDGNQALINPLSIAQRLQLFKILITIGFKEIEVGFPSASKDDFDFVQLLINGHHIPDDVTIAILTPAREHFIQRSFTALVGVKRAIIHLYNSTSKVQREKVFKKDKSAITQLAVDGAILVQQCAKKYPETNWTFQYSPESFSATELDYAVQICNAVTTIWEAESKNKIILNLPSTVEMSMPNIYADQIEWFCRQINNRKKLIISVHTHNDRGCAVAAAEMAVLAGADRVEGTLLGNGERTGNMDIITMAMNCYSQGLDPKLDLSNIQALSEQVSQLIEILIHPRHPYIGELVYTAFSGSHQDAIRKCLADYETKIKPSKWNIPYLPIDPKDLGRSYQKVIRINSQSGKGGIAFIVEQAISTQIPHWLQLEFSQQVQKQSEQKGKELSAASIVKLFKSTYLNDKSLLKIMCYHQQNNEEKKYEFVLSYSDQIVNIKALGVGILDSFTTALSDYFSVPINIIEYNEQTLKPNSSAQAITFVRLQIDGEYYSGVGQHNDIVMGSLNAILQAFSVYTLEVN